MERSEERRGRSHGSKGMRANRVKHKLNENQSSCLREKRNIPLGDLPPRFIGKGVENGIELTTYVQNNIEVR